MTYESRYTQHELLRKVRWLKLGIVAMGSSTTLYRDLIALQEADSSNQNPYHNPGYMQEVALRADDLFMEYPLEAFKNPTDRAWQRKVLFLARSLQDVGHRGGKDTDSVNIERTCDIVTDLMKDRNHAHDLMGNVLSTIQVTEYPFVREPVSIVEKCIRDAGWMMFLCVDWSTYYQGLKEELNIPGMTMDESMAFIQSQTFYTPKGQEIVSDYFRRVREHIELALSLRAGFPY